MARKAGFGGGVVVDYPNSKKARKVFLCLMVGSGKYVSTTSNLEDGMEVDAQELPKGLDGAEGLQEQKSIVFERRRAREKGRDKKGKQKGVDKTWILKKKEVSSIPSALPDCYMI
jgi:18S rRNA (guanine1575-N7)-methyltransferase